MGSTFRAALITSTSAVDWISLQAHTHIVLHVNNTIFVVLSEDKNSYTENSRISR